MEHTRNMGLTVSLLDVAVTGVAFTLFALTRIGCDIQQKKVVPVLNYLCLSFGALTTALAIGIALGFEACLQNHAICLSTPT